MDKSITLNDLGDGQKNDLSKHTEQYLQAFCKLVPQIGRHLLSGGVITISTMSGMNIRIGFNPQIGGIITPGGITPHNLGDLKKGF